MELLKSSTRRGRVGELAYVAINAALPVVLLLLVRNFDSPYPAIVLVLLSKWRVLALRPRYWWVNIKSNFVDLLVGLSVVGLLYLSNSFTPLQYILVVGYGVWLLYLKPRSTIQAIMVQAGIAQFLSLTVLFSLSTVVNEFFIILGCGLIGYVCARHVMGGHEEEYADFMSAMWGLFVAELGWLLYYWTNAYDLGLPIKLPQMSLLALVLSFAAVRLYRAGKSGNLSDSSVRLTTISSVILVLVILAFARWSVAI